MSLKIGQKVRIAAIDGPSHRLYSVIKKGYMPIDNTAMPVFTRCYFITPCDTTNIDPENIPRYQGWYTRRELCREPEEITPVFQCNTFGMSFTKEQWSVLDRVITIAASSDYSPYRLENGETITPSVMSSFEDFIQTVVDIGKHSNMDKKLLEELAFGITVNHYRNE